MKKLIKKFVQSRMDIDRVYRTDEIYKLFSKYCNENETEPIEENILHIEIKRYCEKKEFWEVMFYQRVIL